MPGEPRTIVVAFETPGPTQSFPLPQGVVFDVEAVFIQVDTSGAGGPVTAELTIAEQSGQVIAKKRQAETIDAGGSGSATWALRLADDGAGAGAVSNLTSNDGSVVITNPHGPTADLAVFTPFDLAYDHFTVPPGGGGTQVRFTFPNHLATGVWDYAVPTFPVAIRSGLLVVTFDVQVDGATPMAPGEYILVDVQTPAPLAAFPNVLILAQTGEATAALPSPRVAMSGAKHIDAGDGIGLVVANFGAGPVDVDVFIRTCIVGGNDT